MVNNSAILLFTKSSKKNGIKRKAVSIYTGLFFLQNNDVVLRMKSKFFW